MEAEVKNKKDYKVKVTIGDAILDIEGAESGVVKIVEALADVLRGSRKSSGATLPSIPPGNQIAAARSEPVDIRTFFAEKSPSSDVEATAATAYYYKYLAPHDERKETINSTVLENAFRLARRPLPARSSYTLQNTRGAGYLDSAGDGQFRLNPVGFNLVEHALGHAGEAKTPKPKRKKFR
jgi:hypothetical protein